MSKANSPGPPDALRLVALGAAAPQVHELRTRRVTIGTSAGNDLLLNEPTASRRHAALERRWGGRWRVLDLGSTNGTYINGRRISGTAPAPLKRGDELRFGNARFGLVAPRDDLSRIGVGRAKGAARSRRRVPRLARAVVAVLLFAGGGFALTAYLLNFDRLDGLAAGVAAPGAATPAAAASAGSPSISAGVATPPAIGRSSDAAARRPRPMTGSAAAEASAPGAPASAAAAAPAWLARINYYRAMVKLAPVSDEPSLSEGELNHTRYLVKNFAGLIREGVNAGAAMHTEDPTKAGFTPIGLRAARNSDVDEWSGRSSPRSPNWAIDDWMTGAFHRLNILNSGLRQVAYGQSCDGDGVCVAALDVIDGAERPVFSALPRATPLRFPPPGSRVGLGPLFGEWPSPISSCPGYRAPAGLPITLQLGTMVDAKIGAYRLVRNGDTPMNLDTCGFDASSYNNSDAAAQQRGRDVLRSAGAVAVVPRAPLEKDGNYTVSMTINGREYKWSFSTLP